MSIYIYIIPLVRFCKCIFIVKLPFSNCRSSFQFLVGNSVLFSFLDDLVILQEHGMFHKFILGGSQPFGFVAFC